MNRTNAGALVVLVCGGVLLGTVARAETRAASYTEVRERVYSDPLETLPDYDRVNVGAIVRMSMRMGGPAKERAAALFTERVDLREAAPKLTHAPGVCADATWSITAGTGTGLLAPGTRVPAIVRFSEARNTPTHPGPRSVALGVKVWPTDDPFKEVLTANLATSDQFGIDGQERLQALRPEPKHGPLRFMNTIWGTGMTAEIVNQAFTLVDPEPTRRPLYPFTTVGTDGKVVSTPKTPRFLHLVLRRPTHRVPIEADFRQEIMHYKSGELVLDIVVPSQKGFGNEGPIGTLVVGAPVVSKTCDLELSFYHHPTNPSDEAR